MICGFLFGSICTTFGGTHVMVWVLAWPILLPPRIYGFISGLIACKLYGHIDHDYAVWSFWDSKTAELHCNRCGKMLKIVPLEELDSKAREWIDTIDEITKKMFADDKKETKG